MTRKGSNCLRVLSIDGGGMRGFYTCAYLAALSTRYSTTRNVSVLDIGAGFDLITGTSTGAIIACALAAGVPLERVASIYSHHGSKVFPTKLPKRFGPGLLWQLATRPRSLRSGANALKALLDGVFGDTTIGDIWRDRRIALAIPAVEMSRYHAWVFKTPHLANSKHRDDGYKLSDACLAATAAPVYRSMACVNNADTSGHHVFLDGGLWANNPVLVGLIDALGMTQPGDEVEIFCLGTCPRPEGEQVQRHELARGLLGWGFGGEVVTMSIGAQEYAFDNMARMLAGHVDRSCRIVRFPHGSVPASVMDCLDLDETSKKAMCVLMGQAQNDVNETLSRTGDRRDSDGQLLDRLFRELPVATDNPGVSQPLTLAEDSKTN